ncbi:hypothetical protein H2201_008698 [Coniosporium apollinis]|uniref:Fungal-type protein kinase domain-containing protein n=1 Tax=Coniosporium apollinis TaxID=61459 RepID=A0ABQ9NI04_9PEZI|nr:hypothetical protein H2201_008698 [Coniosporium apollinis]
MAQDESDDGIDSDGEGDVSEYDPEADENVDPAVDRISELVLRLSISFATEGFVDGQPQSSLLVYFSGVLGLSDDGRTFRRVRDYTSILSGLIYQHRLLFLEYALPYRAYRHIGIEQRPRQDHLARLNEVRLGYMVQGCLSPLGEFLSLRDYGRVLGRSDLPAFMVRWSDDGQILYYGEDHITLQQFRDFTHKIVKSAATICARLMYDWQPEVDLGSIKDDLRNSTEGFSFVQHPVNRLADAYLELSARACMDQEDGLLVHDEWNGPAIFRYFKWKEELIELLAAMLYVDGGQAPRSTELLSIEFCNGPATERGVYVYEGSMIYVTRHHKARKNTNKEFYVVRYLPAAAGKILFYYLVYIRPFTEMVKRQVKLSGWETRSSLLFCSDGSSRQLWKSQRLSAVLQRNGAGIFQKPFGVKLCRQLSISITEKHVQRAARPFNRYDDKSTQADINVVFAWQSCHRPLQRATTYGLDGAFPAQLQPALLRVYRWASNEWQEFLGQDTHESLVRESLRPSTAADAGATRDGLRAKLPTIFRRRFGTIENLVLGRESSFSCREMQFQEKEEKAPIEVDIKLNRRV